MRWALRYITYGRSASKCAECAAYWNVLRKSWTFRLALSMYAIIARFDFMLHLLRYVRLQLELFTLMPTHARTTHTHAHAHFLIGRLSIISALLLSMEMELCLNETPNFFFYCCKCSKCAGSLRFLSCHRSEYDAV